MVGAAFGPTADAQSSEKSDRNHVDTVRSHLEHSTPILRPAPLFLRFDRRPTAPAHPNSQNPRTENAKTPAPLPPPPPQPPQPTECDADRATVRGVPRCARADHLKQNQSIDRSITQKVSRKIVVIFSFHRQYLAPYRFYFPRAPSFFF